MSELILKGTDLFMKKTGSADNRHSPEHYEGNNQTVHLSSCKNKQNPNDQK